MLKAIVKLCKAIIDVIYAAPVAIKFSMWPSMENYFPLLL